MYGTVARLKVHPGKVTDIKEIFRGMEAGPDPGEKAAYLFLPDGDPDSVIIVAVFESKDAYIANANRPETHERFLKLQALLAEAPDWSDGEVLQHLY